jgi:hypothetical protein
MSSKPYEKLNRVFATAARVNPLSGFHKDKTRSFYVDPSRQTFQCRGCGLKGGAIYFIARYENVSRGGSGSQAPCPRRPLGLTVRLQTMRCEIAEAAQKLLCRCDGLPLPPFPGSKVLDPMSKSSGKMLFKTLVMLVLMGCCYHGRAQTLAASSSPSPAVRAHGSALRSFDV